jgi:hypothetical protein
MSKTITISAELYSRSCEELCDASNFRMNSDTHHMDEVYTTTESELDTAWEEGEYV